MSPLPNPDAMVKFPAHLMPSFEASLHLRPHVSNLISTLSAEAKRIIIIHDSLMTSVVQDACSIPNVETYAFQSTSAFTFFFNMWDTLGKPFPTEAEIPTELPSLEGCFTSKIMNLMAYQFKFEKFKAGDIYNTNRVIESTYLDLLQRELANESKQLWAIGPLNKATLCYNRTSNGQQHKCLEWLDKQALNSVLYMSFGTTTSMADQQITELALGLEQSEIKFLWVLRNADKGNVFTEEGRIPELPKGKAMAMEVRDWAPQQEILGHPSTGGFMSHCDWNSCMESISMGVPIAAWPMHSDQPRNDVLITELLKVGLSVKEWANRDKLLTSSMIRIAVRKLMASTEGDAMRKRAEVLGRAVRQSTAEDGVSCKELDSFIAHITR